jgi:hypothetical protein
MRPTTFICALAATLQLLSGTALADGWTWPIRGPVITAYRNGDNPYAGGQHRGVDIAAPIGSRVVAATSGTVTFAGVAGSSGLVVSERTADGRFDLSYLHLSSASVRRGDRVSEGASVGAVGTSGRRSAEQPHLHFGVREAGERSAYRDPLDFLSPPPVTDRHHPAPAPVPVGEPAAAGPEPAGAAPGSSPVPSASSVPWPSPLPTLGPAPSPDRSPMPSLGSAPSPGRSPMPSPGPAPGHSPVPSAPRAPGLPSVPPLIPSRSLAGRTGPATTHPDADPRAHGAPRRGARWLPPNLLAAPGAAHRPRTTPASATHHATNHAEHHGIDLGWLAACIGLIALATALGHPDGTRRAAARTRAAASRRRPATRALMRPAQRGGQTR